MELYIGLDVSLGSTAICAVSTQGKLHKETTAASKPEELVRLLRSLPATVVGVGLEAGPLSQWLHRAHVDAGFDTVLMETRQVKVPCKRCRSRRIGEMRRALPGLCTWGGRPVHSKSISAQEMRALLSERKAIWSCRGLVPLL